MRLHYGYLHDDYAQCDFIFGVPVVSYRETVVGTSCQACLSKSHSKHNRMNLVAEPLPEELGNKIESGKRED